MTLERFRNDESKQLDETFQLIKESLEEMLSELSGRVGISSKNASQLLSQYRNEILNVMKMPHGGTFSPEDFAEMIIVQYMKSVSDL